jgi:protease IV
VAEPATLTGSIGVFGGKFVVKELLGKLGLTTDSVQFGANAAMWSSERDFTAQGWSRLEASLDAVYRDFTTKVVQGRGLEASRIPAIAKGRVFTGEEAREAGLVDALGGWPAALALARQAAGLGPEEPVELRPYPRPGRELQRLLDRLLSDDGAAETRLVERLGATLAGRVPALRPLLAELPALVGAGDAYLLMPPLEVR